MSKQLSEQQVELIKSSVPVLAEHGLTITKQFYADLFEAHPELLNLFNHANQKQDKQQQALANTLYAAAANIENLGELLPVVKQIAHKHRSLQVKPKHYPIVGEHLLGAIKKVIGSSATNELLDAWANAYDLIAEVFISVEAELYKDASESGWEGFRRFIVQRKEQETKEVVSFYLVPEDEKSLPPFEPGQYVTVKGYSQSDHYTHLRQYSLSDKPDQSYYRLSIKREETIDVQGTVSWYMHGLEEGAVVEITAPAGEFTPGNGGGDLVLISAGIGITPLTSIAKSALAADPNRAVTFVHFVANRNSYALRSEMEEIASAYQSLRYEVYERDSDSSDVTIDHLINENEQQFYICGPVSFVQQMEKKLQEAGVSQKQVHFEVFTPLIPVEA